MIDYRIEVPAAHGSPRTHQFHVTLTIPAPATLQQVSLPVWIPGSYLVREFARHLSDLVAVQGGIARPVDQLDKATWSVRCEGQADLVLTYRVHALDSSVRAAFLDARRGFFNGTGVFLRVEGREAEAQQMTIGELPEGWQVATAMPVADVDALGRGRYQAADYDALVDHPVELGQFWRGRFEARSVPHEFIVAGAWPDFDGERLLRDTQRICEAEIDFWHPTGRAPFERYVFMLNVVEDGYGGLEHRASTALIAARRDLPRMSAQGRAKGDDRTAEHAGIRAIAKPDDLSDGYVTLLGLISHEYFHTWNVKRLKPREFTAYDYTRENYTELLWFFEGFTSYYDDLLLLRAGLIDLPRYLKLVGKTVTGVLGLPGRQVQSVAQASFDAWVKYYRSDENTPNATVSYYTKGSLVAMALDLTLRAAGSSLDDVMRDLWTASGGGGIDEADIERALGERAGRSLAVELRAFVHGTDDLPLETLLTAAGIQWQSMPGTLAQRLGLRVAESALTGVKVTHVLRGGAAEAAGLAAGDELLAVDGWRLRRLDDAERLLAPGATGALLISRDQRVLTLPLAIEGAAAAPVVTLVAAAQPSPGAMALRAAWLGG